VIKDGDITLTGNVIAENLTVRNKFKAGLISDEEY